ncbi:MAG: hypothetical protein GY842_02015 [bacterium]|nr:hypothetical protein [bacterium]
MNEDEHNSDGDVVEDAVRQLTSAAVDENRLMAGVEKTRAALAEAVQSDRIAGELEHRTWRSRMNIRRRQWVAVAAVIAIGFGAWAWLWPESSASGVAFGQVMQRIRSVQAVTFKMTIPVGEPVDASLVPVFEVMESTSGRTRQVFPGGTIMISDPDSAQHLMLDPHTKHAALTTVAGKNGPREGVFSILRKIRDETGVFRGSERLDDRTVSVFEAEAAGERCVVWADSSTGLPVRAELHQRNMTQAGRPIVLHDFEYDVELDESLFSITPPAGYELEEKQINIADLPSPTEQDLVGILAVWVDLADGVFPAAFDQMGYANTLLRMRGTLGAEQARRRIRDAFAAHLPDTEGDELARMHQITSGFLFSAKCEQWRYVGKGLKLGETDSPVCWWKNPEADTFRVVYADLTLRTVSADELPEIP